MGLSGGSGTGRWPGIVLCATLAAPAVAMGHSDAATPVRILAHEAFRPILSAPPAGSQKASTVRALKFDAYGRRFNLALELNPRLTAAAKAAQAEGSALSLYQGTIENVPGSWVRMSAKAQSISGMIWDGDELYLVDSAAVLGDDARAGETIIFKLSDAQFDSDAPFCGKEPLRSGKDAYAALVTELKNSPIIMQAAGASTRLEVSALADSLFRNRYSSVQTAREAVLVRLNNVDGIFSSQLGVEIQVPTTNIDDALTSQLPATTDANTLVSELGSLRERTSLLRARGLTHLFTGRDLDGTTVGIAYTDSLCHRRYGAGLTQTSGNSTIDSLITAHEIGHNFGAPHDGDPEKQCASTPQGQYLMSPSVNAGATTFSQCSVNVILPRMQAATCLLPLTAPDLSIPIDLGTHTAAVGRPFEWQLEVRNTGGSTAISSSARLFVPPVVMIDDVFVAGGTCTSASGGGAVTCEMGNIPAGGSRVIAMTMHSDIVGSNSISAHVSTLNDAQTSNNSGDGTLVIEPEADLAITADAPATGVVGSNLTASFTVTNAAVIDVTGVQVEVSFSEAMQPSAGQIAGGDCTVSTSSIRCTVASLAANGSAAGTITATPRSAGTATIATAVSGDYVDPNSANDRAERSVSVAPVPSTEPSNTGGGKGGGGSTSPLLLLALSLLGLLRRPRA